MIARLRQGPGARVALWVAIIAVAALAGLRASSVEAQPSPCGGENPPCENWMSVTDTEPAAIGDTVAVDLRIDEAYTPYQAYAASIEYDSSVVALWVVHVWGCWFECWQDIDAGDGLRWTNIANGSTDPTTETGVVADVWYECVGPGTTALRLVPPSEGSPYGTTTFDSGHEVIPTGLTAGLVECEEQADIQVTKDAPETVLANEVFDYVVTVHNAGPNPAQMVAIGDNLPEYPIEDDPDSLPQKEYLSYELYVDGSGPLPLCEFYAAWVHPITLEELRNIVTCDLSTLDPFDPGSTAVLTITVRVPTSDAGLLNVNTAWGGSFETWDPDYSNEVDCASVEPPLDDGNFGCAVTEVLPLSAGTATPLPTATPTPLVTATITPTPTITLTPTVTPTQPPCIDWFGDTSCEGPTDDADNDGCTDTQEAALGDSFRPDAWFDVYDVPVPAKADANGANGTRNRLVDVADVLAVAFYVFADNDGPPNASGVDYDSLKGWDLDGDSSDDIGAPPGIEEGLKYDRSPGLPPSTDTGLDPAGPPNGAIDMADVLAVAAQAFAIDCTGP